MIPAALGDFTIESLLGEGGSSLVYAARRTEHPTEELALKVLHPDLGLTERETDRFLDEARKLLQLSHPGIVSLRASGRLPDRRPYIAMPRLKGQSLGDRLRSDAIPSVRALALFADVANAVSALHEAGLLHRDIKPDNVFWLDPGDRLMLLDLGIARDTESSPGTTTRAGLSRGTPEYMAPERLFGQRATVKTDVYELALLLYVMLARRPPWTEGDAHARLEPRFDPELAAALPPLLVKAMQDGLALDVARRPSSVREFVDRIEEATGGTNFDAARPSLRSNPNTLPSAGDLPATRLVLTPRGPVPVEGTLSTAPTELHTPPYLAPAPYSLAPTPSSIAAETVAVPQAKRSVVPIAAGGVVAIAGIAAALLFARPRGRGDAAAPTLSSASAEVPADALARPSVSDAPLGSDPASSAPLGPSAAANASGAVPSVKAPSAMPSSTPSTRAAPTPFATSAASAVASSSVAPVSSATNGSNAMPGPCKQLIALVCSPTSGARPEECTSWSENARRWTETLPPAAANQICQSAFNTENSGLALRRNSKPPP